MRLRGRFPLACPGLLALAMLCGCSGYSRFTLPLEPGGPPLAFRWEASPAPVLERGAAGDWDSVDALNPSVVKVSGTYYNLYSGFDGRTWRTGLASSADGLRWTKLGRVLSPGPAAWEGGYIAANGHALAIGGEFLYWYQAGSPPAIGLARSTDGRQWVKQRQPVLRPGPQGSWDERGVADPYVIRAGGTYYMYYLGQDRARRQRLGLARSPDGVRWQRLTTNPVLELGAPGAFDERGLGEPAVWSSHGRYWMLYTGRDRQEYRRIGAAWSLDGVRWTRLAAETVFSGGEAWNAKVVCDPTVLLEDNRIRVWFGGGDAAHPVERLNGAIGYAILVPAGANLK
ncbi:MAG: hypothetical protein IT159_00885 [Bryobacterales bacterium]|nr:hypothetical protein [Bryobacterales bacterium]